MARSERWVASSKFKVELTARAGNPVMVPRVLDVNKGQLCWIIGTVYMDMPLKPNILEDIGKDVRTSVSH